MRQHVVTAIVGVAAGLVGALALGAMRGDREPTPAPAAVRPEAVMRPPPGWNARYLGRPELAAAEPAATEPTAEVGVGREAERSEQYHREIDDQTARLAAHEREVIDDTWARASTDQIRTTIDNLAVSARRIDCRSKTCVAELTFATPTDALAFAGSPRFGQLAQGLGGMISTPTPPDGPGAYALTVVLTR